MAFGGPVPQAPWRAAVRIIVPKPRPTFQNVVATARRHGKWGGRCSPAPPLTRTRGASCSDAGGPRLVVRQCLAAARRAAMPGRPLRGCCCWQDSGQNPRRSRSEAEAAWSVISLVSATTPSRRHPAHAAADAAMPPLRSPRPSQYPAPCYPPRRRHRHRPRTVDAVAALLRSTTPPPMPPPEPLRCC